MILSEVLLLANRKNEWRGMILYGHRLANKAFYKLVNPSGEVRAGLMALWDTIINPQG